MPTLETLHTVQHMKKRVTSGFTVLELIVTLSLMAIVTSLAAPNLVAFVRNGRLTTAANDVVAAIHAARSEAIKRQARIVFCFSAGPEATTPACDGTGTEGWIVFVDADSSGTYNAGEAILQKHGALPTGVNIRNSTPSGNEGYVSFQASGFANTVTAVGQPISSFLLCDDRGNAPIGDDVSTARALQVSALGRPSVSRSVTTISALGNCS